jgi:4'-phosphopantetheinyl transferase
MELYDNQVHFWFTPLGERDPRIPALARLLSVEETRRAERFHFNRDRASYIMSHGVLRQLLARYTSVDPRDIEFTTGPYGKPSLSPVCGDVSLQFNMSHTGGLAVYAVTRNRRIGVDVERVDREIRDRDTIAADYFSPAEAEVYGTLPEEEKVEGFFNCWTRKESYLKAKGDGLSSPLDSFEVTLRPGDPARLLVVQEGRAEDWSMVALEPVDDYIAAITAEAAWQLIDLGEFHSDVDLSRT